MKLTVFSLVAVTIVAQPLVNEDVLEPSVMNEVEHALAVAPTNAPPVTVAWDLGTNRLSRTALALRLVLSQRADGRWFDGTNDVTSVARRLLESLAEE